MLNKKRPTHKEWADGVMYADSLVAIYLHHVLVVGGDREPLQTEDQLKMEPGFIRVTRRHGNDGRGDLSEPVHGEGV
jgi:hypothetical protein